MPSAASANTLVTVVAFAVAFVVASREELAVALLVDRRVAVMVHMWEVASVAASVAAAGRRATTTRDHLMVAVVGWS